METNIKKPRERSKEYPQYDLNTCIQITEEINSKLGNRFSSLTQIAKAIGNVETRASTKLSSCRQFGLVELRKKEGYKPTEAFYKATRGRTEQDKKDALIQCLKTPTIYGDFISKHNGEPIPSDLPSIFYWDYKITEGAKNEAAEIFRTCLDQLGLIKDGKLNLTSANEEQEEEIVKEEVKIDEIKKDKETPIVNDGVQKIIPPAGKKSADIKIGVGRFVTVIFPENITNEEIDRFIKNLELWKD